MTLYASRPAADVAAERLKIYAQPQRLMILSRLLEGEHTVSEIDEATGIGQPALSQQLAELRRAEIVKTRRVSKQVHYRLADENVVICVRGIEAMFGGNADPVGALSLAIGGATDSRLARRPSGAAAFARIE
ncbi:metalloregulator ArsR/SmtB family transcription factor [Sphingomonas sp. R647]|uniref:ArsR/SmtB family transcription factor n=1 Tax=Sphingomonas sp. R647 TaxID=2875233 RepID=UPI001CD216D3|nr:metalloregulator ArsR/SmtB family transcription factor [Sphingomonas sp. R647]MCA1198825.1 metalloregulator ArsR/SmtB family transcription factor [Sphingomonas sp. R647]